MSAWLKKHLGSRGSLNDEAPTPETETDPATHVDWDSGARRTSDIGKPSATYHHTLKTRHSTPTTAGATDYNTPAQADRDAKARRVSDIDRPTAALQLGPKSPQTKTAMGLQWDSPESKVHELRNMRVEVQKKTFTKWCNVQLAKLGKGDEYKITDLAQDLRDGIRLSLLIQVLSGETLPKPERTPRRNQLAGDDADGASSGALMRIYSIVNVDKCLKFLATKLREPLANIGSEDIVDGNVTLTMGLVWILILRFRIETIAMGETKRDPGLSRRSLEHSSPDSPTTPTASKRDSLVPSHTTSKPIMGGKAVLLNWCQQMLAPYVQVGALTMPVNFSDSWQSGVAFLCLVHTFDPALLPDVTETCRRLGGAYKSKRTSSTRASRTSSLLFDAASTPPRAFSPDFSSPTDNKFGEDEEWLKALYASGPPTTNPPAPTRPRSLSRPTAAGLSVLTSPTANVTPGPLSSAPPSPAPLAADTADPREWRNNLARAFGLAEEHMRITSLLDPQDVANVDKPDEMVIMTYVSELYWVLRTRPFPSPTLFRTVLDTARQEQFEGEAQAKRLTSSFLHHSHRALAWILKQQQATGALEGMLEHVASNEVTKLIIPVEGWVKPIMEAMMYEDSDFDRVRRAVEERIHFMHEQIRIANARPAAPGPHTWTRDALIQLDEVAGGAIVPVVHQLYRELKRLTRDYPVNSTLNPDLTANLRKVEEKYVEVQSRLAYFCDEYFPDRDVVLRAYLVWMEGWAKKVDAVQEELLGSDGKSGLREDIRRVKKHAVELELDIARIRTELNALGATEDARRAVRRCKAMRKVVQERLGSGNGGPAVGGGGGAGGDDIAILLGDPDVVTDEEKQSPEALIATIQHLASTVESTHIQRMQSLESRATELVHLLENQVVDRRNSHPDKTTDALHGEVFRPRSGGWAAKGNTEPITISYNFLPAFLVWRGRGIVEAATDGVLNYIAQTVTPVIRTRQAEIASLLHAAEQWRSQEEAREVPVRTAAVDATRDYCAAVRRVDRAVKMWKDELAEWINEGSARGGSEREEDEVWVREAEKWCAERTREVQKALQSKPGTTTTTTTKRPSTLARDDAQGARSSITGRASQTARSSSHAAAGTEVVWIADLDLMWDGIVLIAIRDVGPSSISQSFADAVPHQFLRNAMSALIDSLAMFRSDALERVRGAVEQKREALLVEWERTADELDRALRPLGGDTDAVDSVHAAAETSLQNTVQGRHQFVRAMLDAQRWDAVVHIAEAGVAAPQTDLDNVGRFLKGVHDRCHATEQEAATFEQTKWIPFLVRTETLLQGCGTDSVARTRIETRHGALKELLGGTRRQRADILAAVATAEKSLKNAYRWIRGVLTQESTWLGDARDVETEVETVESEQNRLLAAMRTVIYNTGHGQVMGQEEALSLHEATGRTLEQTVTGRLDAGMMRVCEEPRGWRDGGGPVPEELRWAEGEVYSGRDALVDTIVKRLQDARMRVVARITTVRTRVALERSMGRFTRDAAGLVSALCARLEVERGVIVPHGLDVMAAAGEADDAGSVEAAAAEFTSAVKSRDVDTTRAMAALRQLGAECTDLARRDGECGFVAAAVDTALRDAQSLVEEIAAVVRRVMEAYEIAAVVVARVGHPGRKIEEACREIGAAVREVAGVAEAQVDDESSASSSSSVAIVEHIRVLADRAASLTLLVDEVERALGVDDDDDQSQAYVRHLRNQVRHVRVQTEEAGLETVKAVAGHWMDVVATKLEDWIAHLEQAIRLEVDDDDTDAFVHAMDQKCAVLNKELQPLGPKLQSFETATEIAIRVIREWETRRTESSMLGDHHHHNSTPFRSLSDMPHPEVIQGRYVAIRARADYLPRGIREAVDFARTVAEFNDHARGAEHLIAELGARVGEDETEARVGEVERALVNGELAAALDAVHAAAAVDGPEEDEEDKDARDADQQQQQQNRRHPKVVQSCTRRFEAILDQVQRVRGLVVGSRRARDAVQAYLTQAAEVRMWVHARMENLAVVSQDVDDESTRVLEAIRIGLPLPLEETVALAATRSVDREAGLAAAEAALERYNRAYEHLKSYARTVVDGYACNDPAAAATVAEEQGAVDVEWNVMRTRLTELRRRVEWNRRVLMWAKRCEGQVVGGIAHAIKKIGDGDVAVGEVGADPQLEGVGAVVEALVGGAEEEVRSWKEQTSAVLGLVAELETAGEELHDKTPPQLLAALTSFYIPRLHDQTAALERAVHDRTASLRDWAQSVQAFLAGVGECEPWVEGAIRELRDRLYARSKPAGGGGGGGAHGSRMNLRKAESQMSIVSDSRASLLDGGGSESAMSLWNAGSSSNLLNTTNNTTTKPRHLAITGNEAVDKQNLDDWTAVQQRLEKRLGDELADKIEALQSHTAVTVLRHCDTIHLRFSRALGREVQDRVEDLCEKWREATRLVGDEKIGIERARKYLHWHVMLARIEHEAGVIEDAVDGLGRATRVGGGETDLDELQTRLVASERALSMFLQMTEQDKPQDASSTSTRPAVSQDERKVTRTLRRHQSLATLQVMGVAEQFSAAVLKNRSDALSAKMARITARILEARDEVGHRRRLMTVLEEVSRLGGWCERKEMEMLERQAGLPPRVLLDDRPYQKSATAQNTTASLPDTILETVQNALKDSITQNSHIEYELTHSRSALERLAEHLDKNQVTDLQAKFTKIESLVAAEKKRIEATKRLYALDRAMVQVTNWIGAAVAAAEDIAATQRAHQPPRQSLVVEEQFGGGSEDLLNEGAATGTVEEVMELEDRIRAYETTVTGFFNVAAAATDELAGTSPSTSDTASPISPAVAATQAAYRSSITWRTDRVRVEWETLLTLVGSLRGSSEDRRREVEFNDEVDEINRGLIYIQSLITDGANDATWDEAEDLLDARMLPRVAALRRRADSAARDARERKRFVAKHQSLEKRVRALLEQVQKRHSRAEPSLMDRRVARLVEELETCIGEFSPIVQKAAAGAAAASAMAEGVPLPAPSPTTTPTSSTAADLGLLGSTLEKQTEMYEMRISDLLTRLREACIAAHDETSVQEWIGKWETARAWKVQVANELARLRRAGSEHGRGNNKPAQVTTSRTPQMAVTVTESARQRPISDPPQRAATQSRIQSPQPPRAATATPDASGRGSRSSSPRRSNLPLPTRSRSITPPTHAATTTVKIPRIPSTPSTTTRPSTARSSSTSDPTSPHGNPTSDRTVRVYIPSPNAYKADASDPLDVALAQVVNAHPAMIRIEKSNTEQGRYWFGEALRRLCFCRLVRRTVMVRIGGGWQELGTFLADHSALELRIPTVRSFSHPDNILDPTSPSTASTNATETTMIELDPGDTTNPYALSSSKARAYAASPVQSPRKLVAKALAKVATRKAQY